jgi:hypothetical protein
VDEFRARSFINRLKPDWHSTAVSSAGRSGGLLVAWDPEKIDLRPYICCGGLLLYRFQFRAKGSTFFLNVYGPCTDRKSFWQKVKDRGLFSHQNLIVAGDFNFTLSEGESWGSTGHSDPLALFLKTFSQRVVW